MVVDGTRETERDLQMHLNPRENTEIPGSNDVPQSRIHKLKHILQHYTKFGAVHFIAFIIMTHFIVLFFVLLSCDCSAKERAPLQTCPVCTVIAVDACPDGWVGYQRKCYYFATVVGDWNSSKANCSSFNASLAVVDSQEEMDFMQRYKDDRDYWIGLQRDQNKGPWKWINDTIFDERFKVGGGGKCAYLNNKGITGSSCKRDELWICSKKALPVLYHKNSLTDSYWSSPKVCLVPHPGFHSNEPDSSGQHTKRT